MKTMDGPTRDAVHVCVKEFIPIIADGISSRTNMMTDVSRDVVDRVVIEFGKDLCAAVNSQIREPLADIPRVLLRCTIAAGLHMISEAVVGSFPQDLSKDTIDIGIKSVIDKVMSAIDSAIQPIIDKVMPELAEVVFGLLKTLQADIKQFVRTVVFSHIQQADVSRDSVRGALREACRDLCAAVISEIPEKSEITPAVILFGILAAFRQEMPTSTDSSISSMVDSPFPKPVLVPDNPMEFLENAFSVAVGLIKVFHPESKDNTWDKTSPTDAILIVSGIQLFLDFWHNWLGTHYTGGYHYSEGDRGKNDNILFQKRISMEKRACGFVNMTVRYRVKVGEEITAVEARDNKEDDTGGDPECIGGGVGYPFVTIKVTSKFSHGFDHTVTVYGRKNSSSCRKETSSIETANVRKEKKMPFPDMDETTARKIASIAAIIMEVCHRKDSAYHGFQEGERGRNDVLLFEKRLQEPQRVGTVISGTVRYRAKPGEQITEVKVTNENRSKDNGGDAECIGGGVGYPYVLIKVTSQFSKGIDENIYIYGRRE